MLPEETAAAHLDKTLPFLLPLSGAVGQNMCISKMTSRSALPTVLPQTKHRIFLFSLPCSYPYAPNAAVPTSTHRRSPTPAIHLCRFTRKLLFLIGKTTPVQIYMDVVIFRMENNSLLLATYCFAARLGSMTLSFVHHFPSEISPPPREAHKFHGKSVPTA